MAHIQYVLKYTPDRSITHRLIHIHIVHGKYVYSTLAYEIERRKNYRKERKKQYIFVKVVQGNIDTNSQLQKHMHMQTDKL